MTWQRALWPSRVRTSSGVTCVQTSMRSGQRSENVIERAVILADGREIAVEDLPFTVEGLTDEVGEELKDALQQFERQHILYIVDDGGRIGDRLDQ